MAEASDLSTISDQAVADIASGVIQDCGTVAPNECSDVIDRNKIRRERKKCQSSAKAGFVSMTVSVDALCISFNGREDRTLVHENVNRKLHRRVHSFIHFGNLYSASSRCLLRGTPSPAAAKDKGLKQFVESRQMIEGQP